MKELKKRIYIIFGLIIFITLSITYLGIYLPMHNEIDANIFHEFSYRAQSKIDIFNEHINSDLQAANSLSSRTAIRNEIISYNKGDSTLDELSNFTLPKYVEGASVFDDLLLAQRIVNGNTIATLDLGSRSIHLNKADLLPDTTNYVISEEKSIYYIEIISPIVSGDTTLGYDYLQFNLAPLIHSLSDNALSFSIITDPDIIDSIPEKEDQTHLLDSPNYTYYYEPLNSNMMLQLTMGNDLLYNQLTILTERIILYVIIGYLLLAALFYFILVRYSNQQLATITSDRNSYRESAYIDALTKAYSRLYLDHYIELFPDSSGTLVLIDLDNFKMANDRYGHLFGDKLLIDLVKIIQRLITPNDTIIRLGGDEFLILCKNATETQTIQLINSIQHKMKHSYTNGYTLCFSYGITHVDYIRDLFHYIELADRNMYKDKNHKKETNLINPPRS